MKSSANAEFFLSKYSVFLYDKAITMKHLYFLLLFSSYFSTFSQTNSIYKEFNTIKPEVRIPLLDTKSNSSKFNTKSIAFSEIPNSIDFKGTLIDAIKWKDKLGDNLLVLTVNGTHYTNKELENTKTELYVYLFVKSEGDIQYKKLWRIYDFIDCFYIVDFTTYFPRHSLSITDINNDNIAEITFPYVLMCRGDISDDTLKLVMYENTTKYILRGTTRLCKAPKEYQNGGKYTSSENLKNAPLFLDFMNKRWEQFKCLEQIKYPYE